MVGWNVIITLISLACLVTGFPTQPERRSKRSPQNSRSMMIRGYFRGQPIAGYKFDPDVMAAYSLGNMVAAGYQRNVKSPCQDCEPQEPGKKNPSGGWQTPQAPQVKPAEEEAPKWTPSDKPPVEIPAGAQDGEHSEKDDRQSKSDKKPKRRPAVDEDEEDDEEESYQGAPTFSRFFPMTFNFPGSYGRSGEDQGQSPGMATAISNSFSQGKGAIASSQATAFGGPDPGQTRKSLQSRRRY